MLWNQLIPKNSWVMHGGQSVEVVTLFWGIPLGEDGTQ